MAYFNDKISKPKAGRYFSYEVGDFISRVEKLAYSISGLSTRPDVFLENCDVECPLGYQLCSFKRGSYISQFSLPEVVPAALSRNALDVALDKFREIDEGPLLSIRDQQFVIYRAYLLMPETLFIAQHIINGKSRSYLQFREASQLSKANRDPSNQKILFQIKI
jgi:hypothetical protein